MIYVIISLDLDLQFVLLSIIIIIHSCHKWHWSNHYHEDDHEYHNDLNGFDEINLDHYHIYITEYEDDLSFNMRLISIIFIMIKITVRNLFGAFGMNAEQERRAGLGGMTGGWEMVGSLVGRERQIGCRCIRSGHGNLIWCVRQCYRWTTLRERCGGCRVSLSKRRWCGP